MKPKDFSLDFLYLGGDEPTKRSTKEKEETSINDAVLIYSRPILESLKNERENKAHLHDLAKNTSISLKNLLMVVPVLESSGFVETIQSDDITGNDLIKLTDIGKEKIG